jgi:hypothetical protein
MSKFFYDISAINSVNDTDTVNLIFLCCEFIYLFSSSALPLLENHSIVEGYAFYSMMIRHNEA